MLQGASSPAAAHNTLASVTAQVAPPDSAGKGKPASPADQAPYHLTAQGRLTDPSGNPITTARNLTFRLYDALTGGTLLFSEGPISVTPDSNGLFTYQLGSATPFNVATLQLMASKVYLGITVGSDAEMAPRLELTLAPYAASLAPGAYINAALPQASQAGYGTFNAVNTDLSDPLNAGVYGSGVLGVFGISNHGYGLLGQSSGSQAQRSSAGVGGVSTASSGAGGVFTDTAASGTGVVSHWRTTGPGRLGQQQQRQHQRRSVQQLQSG